MTRDEAEKQLIEWAANNARRDDLVRAAMAAGVSKNRIHVITGIARTTIDRILEEPAMTLSNLDMQTLQSLARHKTRTGSDSNFAALVEAGYAKSLPLSKYEITKAGASAAKAAAIPSSTWILDADCSAGLLMDLARQASGRVIDASGGEGYESNVCAPGPEVPDWMSQTVRMLEDRGIAHDLHRR